jgi:acyl-coenzyme A thioesterase 13
VTDTSTDDVPDGFKPLFRTSPFLALVGPLYYRQDPGGFVVGLRVLEKHANARGGAHGGLLLTLADIALGYTAAFSSEPPISLTTASMSADFMGGAKCGDWVEARVQVEKIGGRLAFANAHLVVGDESIARVSAVFARNTGALAPTAPSPDPPGATPSAQS